MPTTSHPAFGTADLTNCEREMIHLAGSIQPYGVLLALDVDDLRVLQASANAPALVGRSMDELLGAPVSGLSAELHAAARGALESPSPEIPAPIRCRFHHGSTVIEVEGVVHVVEGQGLIVELERAVSQAQSLTSGPKSIAGRLTAAISRVGAAPSIATLADSVVRVVRDLIGFDRVMVYRFDPDGHGEIIAEARDPGLEPFLGLHYPASDIPQRARDLYLRTRVRVLADVNYQASPIVPRRSPANGADLDMSLCYLRSMSPLHLQYLKNMGVTATLVTSLIRDGKLWGLIACHHYSPMRTPYHLRTACEILSETVSTRLSALETQAAAHSELRLRRLEQQVVELVSLTGEWRQALFSTPRLLLQAVDATGAALLYEGDTLTAGDVPSSEDLRALADWLDANAPDGVFSTSALGRLDGAFDGLAPTACGALALRLVGGQRDYLFWFRKEQRQTLRWAGDPSKPMIGDDPLQLSPRRSFAVWTEQVRGTSRGWSDADLTTARMLHASLADMIQQIHAVKVLITKRQLSSVSRVVELSPQPMVVVDEKGEVIVLNQAFRRFHPIESAGIRTLTDLAPWFAEEERLEELVSMLRADAQPWIGELSLRLPGGDVRPFAVRVDPVPAQDGGFLGFILVVTDMSHRLEAAEASRRIGRATRNALDGVPGNDEEPNHQAADALLDAILDNARMAMMHLGDAPAEAGPSIALHDVEALTRRAADLTRQMLAFASTKR